MIERNSRDSRRAVRRTRLTRAGVSVLIPLLILGLTVAGVRAYDWTSGDIVTDDGNESNIPDVYDIQYNYIANDNDNMYFRVDVYSDTLRLNGNALIDWCLDIDQDRSTGASQSTLRTCRGGVEVYVLLEADRHGKIGGCYVDRYDSNGDLLGYSNATACSVSGASAEVTVTLSSTGITTTDPISVMAHFENTDGNYGDDDAPDTGSDSYQPPTLVELSSFTATWHGTDVSVAWETATELDTAGFNVWRSTSHADDYVQVNDSLIPSQSPGGAEGASYAFTDTDVTPGTTYYYKLEELEAGGSSNWYGPTTAEATQSDGMAPQAYLPLVMR